MRSEKRSFRSDPTLRIIDFDTTLTAVTKVTFGDSKDGMLGLRIAPVLQEASSAGHGSNSGLPHTGVITNAEGPRSLSRSKSSSRRTSGDWRKNCTKLLG